MISYVSYFSPKFITIKFCLLVIFSIFQIWGGTRRFIGLLFLFYQHFYFHFIAVSCRNSACTFWFTWGWRWTCCRLYGRITRQLNYAYFFIAEYTNIIFFRSFWWHNYFSVAAYALPLFWRINTYWVYSGYLSKRFFFFILC